MENQGKIFSDGADFFEPEYIHLKYRDLRLEMSIDEFKTFCDAMREAESSLEK